MRQARPRKADTLRLDSAHDVVPACGPINFEGDSLVCTPVLQVLLERYGKEEVGTGDGIAPSRAEDF